MPLQLDSSINDFYNSPNDYVLCLESQGEDKIAKAERKGCWTWIKANWLYPDAYKLAKISAKLQLDSSVLSTRLTDLMLAKITKYNLKHQDNPIKKDFFRDFIKEKDVTKGITNLLQPFGSTEVEDFIQSFISEHLQKLTPETANQLRAPLVDNLTTKLREKYPSLSLNKQDIRKIAVTKYCHVVACNFNRGRKIPLDPDKDNLDEYLDRLKQAMKIDFSNIRLSNDSMVRYGKQAFKKIFVEYHETLIEQYTQNPEELPRVEEKRDTKGRTELFRAAEQGNFAEVKRLLSLGCNPNSFDNSGTSVLEAALGSFIAPESTITPLEYNMTGKSYEMVELLVQYKASCRNTIRESYSSLFDFALNKQNYGLLFTLHNYYTPQMRISERSIEKFLQICDLQDLEFFIRYYPTLKLEMNEETALHIFIQRNRLDLLKKYQQLAPEDFKKCLEYKHNHASPLATALKGKRIEIAHFLREAGASFCQDPFLLTISPELTKQLLEEGMDCNEKTSEGISALHHLACGKGDMNCVPILLESGADLLSVLQCNRITKNSKFLERVEKSKFADTIQRPMLHQAILANDLTRIEEEMKTFDLKTQDLFGNTPLRLAIRSGNVNAVRLLSKTSSIDDLIFAAAHSTKEVVALLVTFFVESHPSSMDNLQETLHAAMRARNTSVIDWYTETYAQRFPDIFDRRLFLTACETDSFSVLQICAVKMQESKNMKELCKEFTEAVWKKQVKAASFLLNFIEDTSLFEDKRYLYINLLECTDTEFVEKALKKLGPCDAIFEVPYLIESFEKNHPSLLATLSSVLFERALLLCKSFQDLYHSFNPYPSLLLALAIYTGKMSMIHRLSNEAILPNDLTTTTVSLQKSLMKKVIESGNPEMVAYFSERNPHLHFPRAMSFGLPADGDLLFALTLGNEHIIETLLQAYAKQKKKPDVVNLSWHLLQQKDLSQQSLKNACARAIQIQRKDLTKQECEELANLSLDLKDTPVAFQVLFGLIENTRELSELRKMYKNIAHFIQKLPSACTIP